MEEKCPKCGNPLAPITETATGRKLQRCSTGSWNSETKKNEGCDYVKWIQSEPETLDEKCPKCGNSLVLAVTRFGKKMKKCSTAGWDSAKRVATGCTYVEWLKPGEYNSIPVSGGEPTEPPPPDDPNS